MSERQIKILLVEDDPDDAWVMRNLLSDRWDEPYDMAQVDMLASALERCREDRFDVILLDLSLPDSTGLETFFSVFAHADNVPIVVLSGQSDESVAMKAVQAGAEDYIVKGQVTDRMLVRSIRYAIERSRRHRAEDVMRETREEFRMAQEIQQRLFPRESPTLPGFEIAGALFPATAAAGDYYDFIPMLEDRLGVVVGDVSSHGMGPALLMSETRACLRTLALMHSDVGEILTKANHLLAADTNDFHFMTLAMMRLDPVDRSMIYASAGQRGYLLGQGREETVLDSTSLPLGVRADTIVPPAAAMTLQAGDVVTFFTDGVVEAESPGHVRFGAARALQVIRSERERPAAEIIASLHDEVTGFCRNQPPQDDMTIVIVKVQ